MAKCDLTIELDEPEKIYTGSEKIRGTVLVDVDADVHCKGLEVTSGWRTHGRGNVAREKTETLVLFTGQWTVGQKLAYSFELSTASWPPSYHGNYFNVDHYVDARAKIPWSFDPKASREFLVRPDGPTDTTSLNHPFTESMLAKVLIFFVTGMIGFSFLFVFVALLVNPLIGLVVGAIVVPLILFLGGKYLLPRWLLGKVETELVSEDVVPGRSVRANLTFEPRRLVKINAITAKLVGAEVCVSGSGSNRTTHRNTFFEESRVLRESTELPAGQRQTIELEFPVPSDAPYSIDLQDNDLKWAIDLRIDIPRWPDWKRTLGFRVIPGSNSAAEQRDEFDSALLPSESPTPSQTETQQAAGLTFAEAAGHLWESTGDDEQREVLVEAIAGLTFDMEAVVERRLLYSGPEDPGVYENGYAVWARYVDPPLPMTLYIPHDDGDEFEQSGRTAQAFRGTVLGWDDSHDRLQVKVLV